MYSGPQRDMVEKTIAALKGDERFDALLGTGSLATGSLDAHSDLDFVVLVRADAEATIMAERQAFAARLGMLLTCFTGEHVGEPRLLICLYGSPLLHVDFKFATRAALARFPEPPVVLWARDPAGTEQWLSGVSIGERSRDSQWFEDRTWLWLHYGLTKWTRGEYFEAISTLDFFRSMVLGPMMQRDADRPMRGQRRVETLSGARERLLPTLAGYDADAIRKAFIAATNLYVELRRSAPPPRPVPSMPQALLDELQA